MPYKLITPPALEPITVEDVKLNSRIESDADDKLIAALISSARKYAENYCNRSFLTQTWKLIADSFPGLDTAGALLIQRPYSLPANALLIERGPVQAVSSIAYTDMGSNPQTFDPSQWVLENTGSIARITPIFGQIWPITLPQIGTVTVTFTAGYGDDPDDLEAPIVQALKLLAGHYYDNRAATTAANLREIPIGVQALLDPYQLQIA